MPFSRVPEVPVACQALAEVQENPLTWNPRVVITASRHQQHSHSWTVHTQDFKSETTGQQGPVLPGCLSRKLKRSNWFQKKKTP